MRYLYLALLGTCVIGTLPLEFFLRTRVYARPRRLLLTLMPVVVFFVAWDVYAISRGQWAYSRTQTSRIKIGDLPIEELAFFLVIPTCAILTYEAVLAVRRHRAGRRPYRP